ncbi:MAG TPA: hypothetical protein DD713_03330 [Nitrospiraceae bacterium]|nr:hypothetical protein [Nitrospiraceae bacterium]
MIVRSSNFATFKECPAKAHFMYELGLARSGGKSIDLLFGSIVHDAIDMYNKTGDIQDAFALIDSIKWPPSTKKNPALAKVFVRLYVRKQNGKKKLFSERLFSFFLGQHEWRGRWDGLTLETYGLLIDELKTTNWRFFISKPNDQFISYYKAARERFGEQVHGILLYDFDVARADVKQEVIRFTDDEVKVWEEETLLEIDFYDRCQRNQVWPKRPASCLLYGINYPCPYIPLCQSPNTAEMLMRKMFVVSEEARTLSW